MERYTPILKKCLIPSLIIIIWAVTIILLSNTLAPYIVFT